MDLTKVVEVIVSWPSTEALVDVRSYGSLLLVNKEMQEVIDTWIRAIKTDISNGLETRCIPLHCSSIEAITLKHSFRYRIDIVHHNLLSEYELPIHMKEAALRTMHGQRVRQGRQVCVYVAKTENRGWGVFAAQDIARNEYCGEYVGELVSSSEATRRYYQIYDLQHLNYILTVRERMPASTSNQFSFSSMRTNVDATTTGNFTRFFNHSCEPSLTLETVRLDSFLPRLVFFATRDIQANAELTFHYGSSSTIGMKRQRDEPTVSRQPCHCGAATCQQYLPFDSTV